MMVTFVSQCEKNALPKTRRVLDAFANRIGDNTWQTVITEEGLQTVKKMLRQTASKSTAVSCHWIRSRSRSQFLWVVGNKRKFNAEGYVAVNSTEKELLNSELESDWKYLPLIKSITGLAALFHDWGKASKLFQNKLDPDSKIKCKGDPIRHEWVSCLLFNALVKSAGAGDSQWLESLIEQDFDEQDLVSIAKQRELKPLSELPDAASLVAWLIVSHHRLPLPTDSATLDSLGNRANKNIQSTLKRITKEWGYENRYDEGEYQQYLSLCFEFPAGLLTQSNRWISELKRWATTLNQNLHLLQAAMADGSWRVILHHARLSLMLGDHYYSSQGADDKWNEDINLFANTERDTKALKQKLDEHLCRVSEVALNTVRLLPYFESEPEIASGIDSLKPSKDTPRKFYWQDKAVRKIVDWRAETNDKIEGLFAVNMASTGCGKTIANAKVMKALSEDGDSLRYVLALGLRTLTLQTGDEYRERIGLTDEQLAVLIGSKAVAELHKGNGEVLALEQQESHFEENGAESSESLLDAELYWQGVLPEEELTTVLTNDKDRQLLYAPVLACTIDHIMAATETKRGGKYILPCLRLMSSDLVIDEIDDFSGSDLIAIGRLIHLAGMLGRKVMISSATIPPDLALGYFNAYQEGWLLFAASRNKGKKIGCVWIDEFNTEVETVSLNETSKDSYQSLHNTFIDKRVAKLKQEPVKRKATIQLCSQDNIGDSVGKKEHYFSVIQQAIIDKHTVHNTIDEKTSKQVSFGVVRVANISLCIELTKYLLSVQWPEDLDVRCMAYHSQQVLLLRSEQEKHLDQVLKQIGRASCRERVCMFV